MDGWRDPAMAAVPGRIEGPALLRCVGAYKLMFAGLPLLAFCRALCCLALGMLVLKLENVVV